MYFFLRATETIKLGNKRNLFVCLCTSAHAGKYFSCICCIYVYGLITNNPKHPYISFGFGSLFDVYKLLRLINDFICILLVMNLIILPPLLFISSTSKVNDTCLLEDCLKKTLHFYIVEVDSHVAYFWVAGMIAVCCSRKATYHYLNYCHLYKWFIYTLLLFLWQNGIRFNVTRYRGNQFQIDILLALLGKLFCRCLCRMLA